MKKTFTIIITALAIFIGGISYAADVNASDYLSKNEYGEGDSTSYFKVNEYGYTVEGTVTDYDLKVNYSTDNPQSQVNNDGNNPETNINGYFSENNSGGAVNNTYSPTYTVEAAEYTLNYIPYDDGSPGSGGEDCSRYLNENHTNNFTLGNITGSFLNNYGTTGGAVANYINLNADINGNLIVNIEGDFSNVTVSYGDFCGVSRVNETFNLKNTIGDITGYFSQNYTSKSGGAIANNADVNIKALGAAGLNNQSNIPVYTNWSAGAGAETNVNSSVELKIGNIKGTFVNNRASQNGGAISNDVILNGQGNPYSYETGSSRIVSSGTATIESIEGVFLGNSANYGGAIDNYAYAFGRTDGSSIATATIGSIKADFIGNYSYNSGGAIRNVSEAYGTTDDYAEGVATIGDIEGNFALNHAGNGGAIYNYNEGEGHKNIATIGNITGDFAGNYATSSGGAIYNAGKKNSGSGSMVGNYTCTTSIQNITGDFTGNYARNSGGAIYNNANATIADITGDYTENKLKEDPFWTSSAAFKGGAIANEGVVGNITGNFVNNNIVAERSYGNADGGAIYNSGTTGNIAGDFVGNYAKSTNSAVSGGSISNTGKVGDVTGNFVENYVNSATASASGGAIHNTGTLGNIEGDFSKNTLTAKTDGKGGAISNTNSVGHIKGNFSDNTITAEKDAFGGGIYNTGRAGTIDGDFLNNSVTGKNAYGGAISNSGQTDTISGDFKNNKINGTDEALGGAIHNTGMIAKNGKDRQTYSITKYVATNSETGETISYYLKNSAKNDLQNYVNQGKKLDINETVYSNTYDANQWASLLSSLQSGNSYITTEDPKSVLSEDDYWKFENSIVNSSFTNNSATAESGTAHGGGIYTNKDLHIVADSYDSVFSGNTVKDSEGTRQEGIYVDFKGSPRPTQITVSSNPSSMSSTYRDDIDNLIGEFVPNTLKLTAKNGGTFTFNDKIVGSKGVNIKYYDSYTGALDYHTYTYNYYYPDEYNTKYVEADKNNILLIDGDGSGKIQLDNSIENLDISHNDVTTNVGSSTYLGNNNNSLAMNSGTLNVPSIGLTPMHFNNFAMNGGTINLNNVTVDLANKKMGRITADTYNDSAGQGTVNVKSMTLTSDGKSFRTPVEFADKSFKDTVKSPVKTAMGKLYQYEVTYETIDDNGHFVFTRGDGGSDQDSYRNFNPNAIASAVNVNTGACLAMNNTFTYVFEHLDAFTQFPKAERFAMIKENQYALSTPFNNNLNNADYSNKNRAYWVRPFATFENTHLKHGPKVDIISYGTLAGYDTPIKEYKNGWVGVGTAYLGYNGSQLSWGGMDTSMNGGLLGYTHTFYKGNFWTALTVSAGASAGDTSNDYGHENFATLMAGVANRTGYNFEFKRGKYIIQPMLQTSYTFVNTFDYKTSNGVKITDGMGNYLQLHPSVRFVGNLKHGWQIYAQAGLVWDIMNLNDTKAAGVRLPNMYVKPYAEYGLGLQRHWGDRFIAFGQAMVRSGGRNGVALTFGFRWALGK